MDFLNNTYNVLFRPTETFDRLAKEYNIGLVFQGLLAFLLAISIQQELHFSAILDGFLLWLFIMTLIFLVGFVFKLKGDDFFKIVCLASFAHLPLIFSSPLYLLADLHEGLSTWLGIALLIWVFILHVLAISKACAISKRKVILLFSLPIIATLLVISSSIVQIFFML